MKAIFSKKCLIIIISFSLLLANIVPVFGQDADFRNSNNNKCEKIFLKAPLAGWFAPAEIHAYCSESKSGGLGESSWTTISVDSLLTYTDFENESSLLAVKKAKKYYTTGLIFDIPAGICAIGALATSLVGIAVGSGEPTDSNLELQTKLLGASIIGLGATLVLHIPAMPFYKKGNSILQNDIVNPFNNDQITFDNNLFNRFQPDFNICLIQTFNKKYIPGLNFSLSFN